MPHPAVRIPADIVPGGTEPIAGIILGSLFKASVHHTPLTACRDPEQHPTMSVKCILTYDMSPVPERNKKWKERWILTNKQHVTNQISISEPTLVSSM